MFKINEIVISNTTPLTTNVIWVKPVSFGLYKLLVYTDSGWTSVSPDEAKQALINASTEYNTLHSVETLTLQQAVDKVPETDKGLGKMITYFDGTNWQFRQYAGTTLSGWNTVGNWVTVSSSTIDYTGFPLYNITTAIPLTAGQYYTATTARAAVPVNVRKRGLELLYETSAGVWYSERFIGTSVADWTIVNNWEAVLSKTYIDTQDALKIDKTSITSNFGNDETKVISQKGYTDDIAAWLPSAVYSDRVSTDSGSIKGKQALFDSYKTALDLLPNTVLAFSPEIGVKQSVNGLVYKASKLYDMSPIGNDANQATAANQPYIGGNIAPNERMWLWGTSKQIAHSPISFVNGAKWSLVWVGDVNLPRTTLYYGSNQGFIDITSVDMQFGSTTNVVATLSHGLNIIGKTAKHYFICRGLGEIEYWVDGILRNKKPVSDTSFIFQNLYLGQKLKSLRVFNKDLSKSEIEGLDKFLASIYPEHETTTIGSQGWVTSNHLGNVTSDGFVIPEVQGNDAASNAELLANGNFESGLVGAITNEGGVVATYTLNTINPINGTQDGRLQVTTAGTLDTRPIINFGASNILALGKTYKVSIDYKVNSGVVLLRAIWNGTNIIAINKTLTTSGSYEYYIAIKANTAPLMYFNGTNLFDLQIDNISIKEVGWADSQAVYDYYISIGQSVLEATKAAAMFCKYNNSDDNAAVYGYLYNWWAAYLFWLYPPKGLRVHLKADQDQFINTIGSTNVGKLKKEGLTYWNTPNAGATNESGFTALGGGRRNPNGTFQDEKVLCSLWSSQSDTATTAHRINIDHISSGLIVLAIDKRWGFSIRFLKNAPTGNETQELDTGLFTTDIATAQKELTMSFGHKVVEVKVNSLTNNLTNFKVELRNSAGVFIQNIVQGISITANTPVDIPIIITQPVLFQDAKLWITATGNTGTNNLGMQVKILTKQIMY